MKLEQIQWTMKKGWHVLKTEMDQRDKAQLVFVFGHPDRIAAPERFAELRNRYPRAHIVGGSTAGNVFDTTISDDDIIATALALKTGTVEMLSAKVQEAGTLQDMVADMIPRLVKPDLQHVFVLADGISFNGSEVAKGLNRVSKISVTGGLMADQGRFKQTFVMADGPAEEDQIVLIGFYGKDLKIGYGCFAGWGEFGVDRVITKSRGNVVYAIDGQPALTLYKKYLGEFAQELPASGLRFPLSLRREGEEGTIIRTLLAIDEETQSLRFAGDVPEGATVLLMKGNIDNLIESAGEAARQAKRTDAGRGLALVISCVGRKLLMNQMTDEEIEIVRKTLGEDTWLAGFYSNGEIAPCHQGFSQCDLHNQTMTLMTIYEKET